MNKEEKEELQELINLLYNNHLSQYGKRKLENYIKKQEAIIDKTWDLFYEYLSIRPASGMKFLKSKGFNTLKCEKCNFDDENINCKECIKEYFKKVVDEDG